MTSRTTATTTAEAAVSGLTVRRGRTVALDSIDLAIPRGVHGLLGPNGAGKTSFIRVLATIAAPSSGRVELLGHRVGGTGAAGHAARVAVRRRLGYLPQEFGYYPRFTVREFVSYVAWLKEMPARRVPAAVEEAVARVGLGDRIDDRMKTLSGGMVRRVGIAQAIVNDPDLLLFDEPTTGLDPEQRVQFRALMREVGEDATVIVSTHLVEDIAAVCSGVTVIDSGRIAYHGTPQALADLGSDADQATTSGDTLVERGYTAALGRHRSRTTAGSRG